MNTRFICFLAFSAFTLAACATSSVATNAPLAAWARGYGYQPYTLNGQYVYCPGTGNGANCITEDAMAWLRNNQREPEFSMRGWLSMLGPSGIGSPLGR
ncbi:MAG: hypothetical protein ACLPV8_28225 [Steroidobacteraceae bacterium]